MPHGSAAFRERQALSGSMDDAARSAPALPQVSTKKWGRMSLLPFGTIAI